MDEAGKKDVSYSSQESFSNEEEIDETKIYISINSIENIIRNDSALLKFTVKHENRFLGESKAIKINSYGNTTKIYPINFTAALPYSINDAKSIASIVSCPVLIQVLESPEEDNTSSVTINSKTKDQSHRNSRRSSKYTFDTLGMCNVDVLPIILGELICDEKLILETPSYTWNNKAVSWMNLPRLTITIKLSDNETTAFKDMQFNFLNITVESIYNLPASFNEDFEYKCGTVLSTQYDIDEFVKIFESGKYTEFRDIEKTKAWKPLQYLESRARFSKYRINTDNESVKIDLKKKFDLKSVINKDVRRIEWNTVNRTLLEKEDVQDLREKITKYKYWPFEIMIIGKQNESRESVVHDFGIMIYQCYVDIGKLLFPGNTRARVLTQLYTQSSSEIESKTGLRTSIFGNLSIPEENNSEYESYSNENLESRPVFTENGEPVVILIEFELHRPFLPARVFEDYMRTIDELKSQPKEKRPSYFYTPDLVHDQYIETIKCLVDEFGDTYLEFLLRTKGKGNYEPSNSKPSVETCEEAVQNLFKTSNSKSNDDSSTCPYFYIQDELNQFKQYLHETGKYVAIRTVLKNKIIDLLDQKFAFDSPGWYSLENQNFISSCYTYLVDQMHLALSSKVNDRLIKKSIIETPMHLWFRVEEAFEFEDYKKCDKLLTKIIYDNRNCPLSWIKYTIYFIKISRIDEAIECCKEALKFNVRHKITIILYGILLAMKEQYTDAEIFLKAVTHFYPRFAEGWVILHLFYVKIHYFPGIDITLEIAQKCLKDRFQDTETFDFMEEEPIAWSRILCKKNQIFLLAANFLLTLNLYDFAGLALSQELCHNDKSVHFLYFTSVNYYLQRNYEIALHCLREAESIIGIEYSIAALIGHSLYKLGNVSEAIEHYEAADMLFDRPESIHLVHLRMGFYYIDLEEYERAKNVFLRASQYSPSSKTWLGVGIANYHLEVFEDCEIALMEANRIDDEDPEIWAYLCLLSMSLYRYDEFTQCYRQVVKNNLRSDKLWRLITHLMDALGYSSPIIVFEDSNDKRVC